MADLSRRQLFAWTGAAIAASVTQTESAAEPPPARDLEAKLAKPLPEPARALLPGARKSVSQTSAARLRFPLEENSEPCFIYVPSPAGRKR